MLLCGRATTYDDTLAVRESTRQPYFAQGGGELSLLFFCGNQLDLIKGPRMGTDQVEFLLAECFKKSERKPSGPMTPQGGGPNPAQSHPVPPAGLRVVKRGRTQLEAHTERLICRCCAK